MPRDIVRKMRAPPARLRSLPRRIRGGAGYMTDRSRHRRATRDRAVHSDVHTAGRPRLLRGIRCLSRGDRGQALGAWTESDGQPLLVRATARGRVAEVGDGGSGARVDGVDIYAIRTRLCAGVPRLLSLSECLEAEPFAGFGRRDDRSTPAALFLKRLERVRFAKQGAADCRRALSR